MSGSGCGNRRRTRCSRLFAGWLACCARLSRADLVIVDGPLRGRRIDAVPFAFGAQSFTVRAPLIIIDYEHWVYTGGACAYVGPSIRGAIVIHRDPNIGVCSYERHAVVAAEAGALAWCKLYPALAETDFIPGFQSKSWTYGDERNIEPMIAVSVTQKAALALLDDIARVAEPVHAELTPSASAWEKLWTSPWYALWQAFISLQALAVVELALCRLHAYVRMEAGLHVTIPNAICTLELSLNAARAFYFAVDPHFSKGILSFRERRGASVVRARAVACHRSTGRSDRCPLPPPFPLPPADATTVLHTVSMPVATVTTALFFIFFELATESAGMTTSVLRGRKRQSGIVAFAVLMVLSDLAISLSFHWTYEVRASLHTSGTTVAGLLTHSPFPWPSCISRSADRRHDLCGAFAGRHARRLRRSRHRACHACAQGAQGAACSDRPAPDPHRRRDGGPLALLGGVRLPGAVGLLGAMALLYRGRAALHLPLRPLLCAGARVHSASGWRGYHRLVAWAL